MTTFASQTGFNSVAVQTSGATFFSLQKGFSSASTQYPISIGRVFDGGTPLAGTMNVTVESVQGSYSYTNVTAPFVVEHYTDSSGNPIQITVTVSASGYQQSSQTLTPTATGQFIDFNLVAIIFSGLADVLTNVPVATTFQAVETDICLCAVDCQYQELALSDASGTGYKNDTSSFLFDKGSSTNTIDFELWKDGAKVADITDSSYGTYYSSFSNQPNYKGVVLDWLLITNAFGFGLYQFKAVKSIFGTASTFESRLFRALPYSDELADGSVVLKSVQTGNIIGNELDYTDLISGGWVSQYRIQGRFGDKTPTIEQDNYQSSDYTIQQIRDQIRREYTLETKLLPAVVADWLTEDAVLSNSLFITDYNIKNSVIYRQKPVVVANFEDTKHFAQKPFISYLIKFTDSTQDIIKRNF